MPDGTVLDGELVIYRDGRLDFAALQRRIHPSAIHAARRGTITPATLVVFDVLALAGRDLRTRPYWAAANISSNSCAMLARRSY